jgi:hypothetical protein
VGSLRPAEHIAGQKERISPMPAYPPPIFRHGESNVKALLDELQTAMSRVADFDRRTEGMKALLERVESLHESFFDTVIIADATETAEVFHLYDTVLTQRSVLSAMLCSAEVLGSHGSALVDGRPAVDTTPRTTRTVTRGAVSAMEPISPLPTPDLWFETLLARKRRESEEK